MPKVVTQEQYDIAVEAEKIAVNFSVPRMELMDLIKASFEAGERHGLTRVTEMFMARGIGGPNWQQ